ncbi:MAG: hypothetical protein BYD32DRAFT_480283 [Podila humilis]|nr:MAG: hypothetical protein BYD32DRAFT_480283 [Podila humilis]
MAPFLKAEQCTYHLFETNDGGPLQQLPVHVCPDTGSLCIFWQDVRNAFLGIDYVGNAQSDNTARVLFMVDRYGNVAGDTYDEPVAFDFRLRPLRIGVHMKASYRVLYRDHQGQLTPALELRYIYQSWKDAAKNMEEECIEHRDTFLRISGNVEYHLSKLLKHLELMREIRIKIEVDGKLEDQILDEIQEYQQNASVCEYQSACNDILKSLGSPTPRRFLVLPADLSSWEDSDPTTHKFRLYFLCDIISNDTNQPGLPQHWHLSNHPGYILDRHQEFFQAFGGLALTMLKMVRQGASSEESLISPLDTFQIVWNVDPEITGNHITKDTIGPLIDKSISYLQALPVAKCDRQFFWSMKSPAIKDFFVVPDGSNSLGGLCRSTQPANIQRWTCQEHQYQWLSPGAIKTLADFVQGCGGHIDIQRASLSIDLYSSHQAEQLCTLIKNTSQGMDIKIKINWNASRQDLDNLLRDIVNADVYNVELDGVTHNMRPQGNTECSKNDRLTRYLSLSLSSRSVTLLNYPQPQDQYIYLKPFLGIVFKLQLKQQQQVETKQSSMELVSELFSFTDAVMANLRNDLLEAKTEQLQRLLAEAGYHTVHTVSTIGSTFGSYDRNWHREFNITERTLQELRLHEFWADTPFIALEALASLRTLRLDVDDLMIHHEEIDQMLQASLQLQNLIISLQENRTLEIIEKTVEMWQGRSSSLHLTLMEYDSDNQGHVVAQIAISSPVSIHPQKSNSELQGSNASCTKTEFLQWNSDHVWEPLANLTAALLDTATKLPLFALIELGEGNESAQHGIPYPTPIERHDVYVIIASAVAASEIIDNEFAPGQPEFPNKTITSNSKWSALSGIFGS